MENPMDTPDHFTTDEMLRIEALDRAVRVSMAKNNAELNDAIVDRSEKFYAFLSAIPGIKGTMNKQAADDAPVETVVRDADGDVAVKTVDGWRVTGVQDDRPSDYLVYPAVLLYRPTS